MNRPFNFSAGPAAIPEEVLQTAAAEMLDWHGSGMGVMEMSHRGKEFISIYEAAEADLRELLREGVTGHRRGPVERDPGSDPGQRDAAIRRAGVARHAHVRHRLVATRRPRYPFAFVWPALQFRPSTPLPPPTTHSPHPLDLCNSFAEPLSR